VRRRTEGAVLGGERVRARRELVTCRLELVPLTLRARQQLRVPPPFHPRELQLCRVERSCVLLSPTEGAHLR
jgi:hypothetical protein